MNTSINNEIQDGMAWLIDQGYSDTAPHPELWSNQEVDDNYTEPLSMLEIDRSDASQSNIKQAKRSIQNTGIRRYTVLWQEDGASKTSPWFSSKDNAEAALSIIRGKGLKAIIYAD